MPALGCFARVKCALDCSEEPALWSRATGCGAPDCCKEPALGYFARVYGAEDCCKKPALGSHTATHGAPNCCKKHAQGHSATGAVSIAGRTGTTYFEQSGSPCLDLKAATPNPYRNFRAVLVCFVLF